MSYTCLSPILVPNPKYRKSDGFGQMKYISVPCGKCYACLMRRRQDWLTRIHLEMENCSSVKFLTLTYNEESEPHAENGRPCFCKEDLQRFHKRLRKRFPDMRLKYYVMSEYGDTTSRPHYHGIYFNLPEECFKVIEDEKGYHYLLADIWQKGIVTVGKIADARIQYVTGYIMQRPEYKDEECEVCKPFVLVSQGIGKDVVLKDSSYYKRKKEFRVYDNFTRSLRTMPRYFRNKLWTQKEIDQIRKGNEYAEDVPNFGAAYQSVRDLRERRLNNYLVKKNVKKRKKHE